MNLTIVGGPMYGLTEGSNPGDATRYVAVVRVVCTEVKSSTIIVADTKQYQADVMGMGKTIPLALAALHDAIQAVVDTNNPERAVKDLAEKKLKLKSIEKKMGPHLARIDELQGEEPS